MSAVYFYHLTDTPLEVALPPLLGKCAQAGWRVVIRGRQSARLEWLDQRLWLGDEAGFLPHGLAGGAHDAHQPVLLGTDETPVPDGACLMTIDGAPVDPAEVGRLARTCILFDGNDPDAVQSARAQWKALTDAGSPAQYWAQEAGRWIKKAEKIPAGA